MPITPNSARAYYGLQATADTTKTQVSGTVTIGISSSPLTLTGATKAYCVSATLATASDTLTIDTETGIATIGTAPVAQVETATVVAAGGATSSGNLAVTVTAARVTGSPLAFSVALVNGVDTTAALIAAKIRTAFSANAALTAVYTVGGTGADITLTETSAENNDATLNIAITAGLGVSAITTSTNTTTGVGGVKLTNNTGDGKDFEGTTLGAMTKIHGFIFKNTGTSGLGVEIGTGDYATAINSGEVASIFSVAGKTNLIGNLQFQALDDSASVEVTIIAQ
jgi:hypothetical protein